MLLLAPPAFALFGCLLTSCDSENSTAPLGYLAVVMFGIVAGTCSFAEFISPLYIGPTRMLLPCFYFLGQVIVCAIVIMSALLLPGLGEVL